MTMSATLSRPAPGTRRDRTTALAGLTASDVLLVMSACYEAGG
jgi:hypothetical protein